jgi:hypothetical protein
MPDSGTMHGYFFGFGTDSNRCSRLMRRTGPIAEYEGTITCGKVHRIACMRLGRRLMHFIDGREAFSWEDPRPLSAGRQPYFALYVHGGGCFENVRAYTRPAADLPTHPFGGAITGLCIRNRVMSSREIARLAEQNLES